MATKTKVRGIRPRRGRTLMIALLAGAMLSWQPAQGADFQAYPLHHAKAGEVVGSLSALLPGGSEVVADPRQNRVLVSGPREAQQIAAHAIESLDRPGASRPGGISTQAKPVMAAYRCPDGKAESTAQWLRGQIPAGSDARIVADPRSSQVLVLAPPGLQSRIAAEIGPPASPNHPTAAGTPDSARAQVPKPGFSRTILPRKPRGDAGQSPAPSPRWTPNSSFSGAGASDGERGQVIQLWHTEARALESDLARMLGARMTPTRARAGSAYELTAKGSERLLVSFDHRAHRVAVEGPAAAVEACLRLIRAMDSPPDRGNRSTQIVPLSHAAPAHLRRAVRAIQASQQGPSSTLGRDAAVAMQLPPGEEPDPDAGPEPRDPLQPAPGDMQDRPDLPPELGPEEEGPGPGEQPAAEGPRAPRGDSGLIGPVQVELLDGLDVLVIRGHRRDVEQVMAVIEQIERLSAVTEPVIEVYPLKHVDCEAVAEIVQQIYADLFEPRLGVASITALVKPNALLLIGPQANVDAVVDLVRKLDRPVAPETQFRVFRLKHAAAETVQAQVQEFYAERAGLGVRVVVVADFRSNSLIVMARPRDMIEVAELIERLDTGVSEAEAEIRVFKLENSLAEDLGPILQEAIVGDAAGARPAGGPGQGAAAPARRTGGGEGKATMLSFATVDTQGQRLLKSGILTDVRITPDTRSNALVVAAPAESMPLIEALIRQLDQMPAAEAQIKVFTIVNGDAPSLVEMLETLFSTQGGAGAGAEIPLQAVTAEGESSLVPLRFAVDPRTNSIIASGTPGFLNVVEAILLRLEESDARNRKSLVYRLRNAPALDVANAIDQFLQRERQVQQTAPGLLSAFEQIEREVVVVPEVVSNSLIVSATPRFYEEIVELIEDIDKRPPMVMIQVLIAEVQLNDLDEFGVELGLQDSILFDRSILGDIATTTQTVSGAAGTIATNEVIQSATITPGFNWNNQPLGNSGAANSTQNADVVGSQGLTNFGLGRVNGELGYGGLVLSASSESVSILIRALKECRRLDVLARPQVMTLDNQPAFVQVGQEVPTIRGTQINETGQVNNIEYANVGLILGVTPRISPDGLVVMEIDAVNSEVGPEAEGIPISISATGDVIRSPRINTIRAQTTVSAVDGQTIVLGGLINTSKSKVHRRVPVLAAIPVLGNLFRYDNVQTERFELLIIMTPHIVSDELDAARVRQTEAARMSWCLGDVIKVHGEAGLRSRCDDWGDGETVVVYPDENPTADGLPKCVARVRELRERSFHFPKDRIEPYDDMRPLRSECDTPSCLERRGAACPMQGAPAEYEMEPWMESAPQGFPTPAPEVAEPLVPAEAFLPKPRKRKFRPFEGLRNRLAGRGEPTGSAVRADYLQQQDFLPPDAVIIADRAAPAVYDQHGTPLSPMPAPPGDAAAMAMPEPMESNPLRDVPRRQVEVPRRDTWPATR